jgi:hypothetical protein
MFLENFKISGSLKSTVYFSMIHLTFNLLKPTLSIRTTRFNIQKSYMLLALGRVFCTDLRKDSDFAVYLYIIKWLVFTGVVGSVYSAVWTDYTRIKQMALVF